MAHKLAGGTVRNGRDSKSKRLGVKLFAGQPAKVGSIIIRQRGTKFRLGENVKIGKDDTIFATKAGLVKFTTKKVMAFTGKKILKKFVNVV
ncbi:50S ribosomal protein L27 [bacterium]|nr:MAG: 50S ribosomal protein L27 [bacterium]